MGEDSSGEETFHLVPVGSRENYCKNNKAYVQCAISHYGHLPHAYSTSTFDPTVCKP